MTRQITTFYRYRGFSTNTLESLCRDTLYFAHPGTFNDPLDCSPTLDCDSSLEEMRELLSVLIRKRVRTEVLASLSQARVRGDKNTSHADKSALLEAQYQLANIAYNATDPEYEMSAEEAEEWLLTCQIEIELCRHYERGVCCFSTSYKDPLLWSHYGDQHRGLCIGYGLDRRPHPEMHRVIYGSNRSIRTSVLIGALVHEETTAKYELDRDVLLRKSREWRYEKEYRLIGDQGERESPLLLKEITFGLRCSESVIHAVTKALAGRDSNMSYFKMNVARERFVFHRYKLDLDELDMPRTARSGLEIFSNLEDDDNAE
jgi:hypothetical protein